MGGQSAGDDDWIYDWIGWGILLTGEVRRLRLVAEVARRGSRGESEGAE